MTDINHDHNSKMIVLIGPIGWWWGDRWDTPEKKAYFEFRDNLRDALKPYFLVYCPHEAFKGPWMEKAQFVNDTAIRTADIVLDMTPMHLYTESPGTEAEKRIVPDSTHFIPAPSDFIDIEKLVKYLVMAYLPQTYKEN